MYSSLCAFNLPLILAYCWFQILQYATTGKFVWQNVNLHTYSKLLRHTLIYIHTWAIISVSSIPSNHTKSHIVCKNANCFWYSRVINIFIFRWTPLKSPSALCAKWSIRQASSGYSSAAMDTSTRPHAAAASTCSCPKRTHIKPSNSTQHITNVQSEVH